VALASSPALNVGSVFSQPTARREQSYEQQWHQAKNILCTTVSVTYAISEEEARTIKEGEKRAPSGRRPESTRSSSAARSGWAALYLASSAFHSASAAAPAACPGQAAVESKR
jgi:hypothetical protein